MKKLGTGPTLLPSQEGQLICSVRAAAAAATQADEGGPLGCQAGSGQSAVSHRTGNRGGKDEIKTIWDRPGQPLNDG